MVPCIRGNGKVACIRLWIRRQLLLWLDSSSRVLLDLALYGRKISGCRY